MTPEIQNMPYQEFVQKLIKPGEVMDKEVTEKEEELLGLAMDICNTANIINDICNTANIINNEAFLFIPEVTTTRGNILEFKHMAVGLVGESAELLDAVKKVVIYRKNPGLICDKDSIAWNVREEIGDLMFFHTGYNLSIEKIKCGDLDSYILESIEAFLLLWNELYPASKVTIEDATDFNKEKLSKRYESLTYTDKQAQDRKDKQEEHVVDIPNTPSGAMQLILDERKRQIEELGWSLEHDDEHVKGELAKAASCYEQGETGDENGILWPWPLYPFKPKTEARNLVKAGALYHAEKGRLERANRLDGVQAMQDNIMRILKKIQNLKVTM
jgi:NTP pyrophosphatase (non-canonical NTP hydrolase)